MHDVLLGPMGRICEDPKVPIPTSTLSLSFITEESQSLIRLESPLIPFPRGSFAAAFTDSSPALLGTTSIRQLGLTAPTPSCSPKFPALLTSPVKEMLQTITQTWPHSCTDLKPARVTLFILIASPSPRTVLDMTSDGATSVMGPGESALTPWLLGAGSACPELDLLAGK